VGFPLSSIEHSGVADALELFAAGGLAAPEFRRFITEELPDWRARIDATVWQRVEAAGNLDDRTVRQRRGRLAAFAAEAANALRDLDGWVTPTVAITPPRLSEITTLDRYRSANLLALRNTAIANFLGLCAITLPVGRDDAGLPVGLQVLHAAGGDEELLAIAARIERDLAAR
ncbi:MAG: amidase, partial [Planctomycetes bacterium]|nr:amidase [Planctomycetota bacterium]